MGVEDGRSFLNSNVGDNDVRAFINYKVTETTYVEGLYGAWQIAGTH